MTAPVQWTRVGAYVVCKQDGALLLTRFRGGGKWTLPGGGLDHAEPPEDGARREVEEETGLLVELGPVLTVHSTRWLHPDRDVHAVHVIYTGEVVGGTLRDEVDGSTDRAAWVPEADVAELDKSSLLKAALERL